MTSDRAVAWVEAAMGRGSRVANRSVLKRGPATIVEAFRIGLGDTVRSVVLKRFISAAWLAERPDLAAYEARVLQMLETGPVPAPLLLDVDPTGAAAGDPALLMTRLPGVPVLRPTDLSRWLADLADTLVRIRDLPAAPWMRPFRRYESDPETLRPPPGTNRPDAWWRAFEILAGPAPEAASVVLHRDFHPENVLWDPSGTVTGIVDWCQTSIGPRPMELAHLRWNVARLAGPDAPSRLMQAVAAATGAAPDHHPYFDLVTIVDGIGEQHDPVESVRVDAYLAGVLAEIG